jgi:hypothetical protein
MNGGRHIASLIAGEHEWLDAEASYRQYHWGPT